MEGHMEGHRNNHQKAPGQAGIGAWADLSPSPGEDIFPLRVLVTWAAFRGAGQARWEDPSSSIVWLTGVRPLSCSAPCLHRDHSWSLLAVAGG